MLEIPVATDAQGTQSPAEPLPAHRLATLCTGTVYRCAETPEETAVLCPPQPMSDVLADAGEEG